MSIEQIFKLTNNNLMLTITNVKKTNRELKAK